MLLTKKNLKTILEYPNSFVIPIFPQLAPPTLVPSEHFILKDFPSYKVIRLAYVKAWQAQLDTREKKH